MRNARWWMILLLVVATRGCSCSGRDAATDDGPAFGDGGPTPTGSLLIAPGDVTIDLNVGVAPPAQRFTAKTATGQDVSEMATWQLDDPGLGSLTQNLLAVGSDHGGVTQLHAYWRGLSGVATVRVRLHATVPDDCPGCPAFPPDKAPPCPRSPRPRPGLSPGRRSAAAQPQRHRDPVRPRQRQHPLRGRLQQQADRRPRHRPAARTSPTARMLDTSGCGYELSQKVWDYVSLTNRGGDPVTVTVRATDDGGACVAASPTRTLLFGEENLDGGLYYWQSVTLGGVQGTTGGIFRYDFGKRGQPPDPFLTPGNMQPLHRLPLPVPGRAEDDLRLRRRRRRRRVRRHQRPPSSTSRPRWPPGAEDAPASRPSRPTTSCSSSSDGGGFNRPPAFNLFDGVTGVAANPAKVPTGACPRHPARLVPRRDQPGLRHPAAPSSAASSAAATTTTSSAAASSP